MVHDPTPVVAALLQRHGRDRHALVQMLREAQLEPGQPGWLTPGLLQALAGELGLGLAEVRAVATAYRFLHLEPVGQYRLLFSDNVTDRMAGSQALMARLCERLRVAPGAMREDGRVSVARCSCIGLGDQGPALLANHRQVVTGLDEARVDELARLVDGGVPLADWPPAWAEVRSQVHRAGPLLGARFAPGQALRAGLARGPQALLDELQASGLRGRGGAGFPAAAKWRACRDTEPAAPRQRVIVCNADEGEPGTFKDRVLLAEQAEAVIEGMTLAALAVGASMGLIYLRGEYPYLVEPLRERLARRRREGLLGRDIAGRLGLDFDIALHVGAGAYVCGEESALLESLEGRRGIPRIRPPYPVQRGYRGRPTVVHNVETLAAVAQVALHGAAAWTALGTGASTGSKLHAVSGDCARPGVYELPFGTTVAELLQACGADGAQAVQVGGPSGQCLAAHEFGRRLAFEDVPTAGAFMVFGPPRDMFEVARGFAHFFAHESCGFCTPCRVGTELVARRLDKLAAGRGARPDLDVLLELDTLLHGATHCGLGATACNPLRDTMARFRPAFERRLGSLDVAPAFDLDAELSVARALTGRVDPGAHLGQERAR